MAWFEDEAFWEECRPFLFAEARLAAADGEVEALLQLAGVEASSDVLDLCCGPGRHACAFARRGFRVTGVDRSPYFLALARATPEQSVEWVQSDMRAFRREAAFDLAVNLFTSFGYFDDPGEDRAVLENLRASLRPGGALVMELMGKEVVAHGYVPTWSQELPDGSLLVMRTEVCDGWSRILNRWTVIKEGRARTFAFAHNIYSGQELDALLRRAGFREVRLYGSLTGAEYNIASARLVAVARP